MDLLVIIIFISILYIFAKSRRKQGPADSIWPTVPRNVVFDGSTTEEQKDAWEFDGWECEEAVPVTVSIDIEYKDGKGQVTSRLVDVNQCMFSSNDGGMFRCFCHLRNATRYFKIDRVLSATDVMTGEVIKDLRGYLESIYESSPNRSLSRTFENQLDAIRILLYVGKADGQLRQAERDVINLVVRHLANDGRITDEEIAQELNGYGNPSIQVFRVAVGKVSHEGTAMKSYLYEAAEKIVATQKTVHAHEEEALDYMKKRFGLT
ncbi:MAG: hypothetical protein HGB02_03895 [Chlorobiaceae bacterium]|nr:hypothetical protein [Chlorobiaceae bacterium]